VRQTQRGQLLIVLYFNTISLDGLEKRKVNQRYSAKFFANHCSEYLLQV